MHLLRTKKNFLTRCFFLAFLILMLLFPKNTLHGASTGLLLWFNTLLPVLLPFMIISGLIVRLNMMSVITAFCYPIFRIFLPISKDGAYPIFIGFLSGLPLGAKTTADLTMYGKINKKEGSYIASLCNNISPMFLINYVATTSLYNSSYGIPLCIIIYLSAILASGAYRILCKYVLRQKLLESNITKSLFKINTKNKLKSTELKADNEILSPSVSILTLVDRSILNSFETITKIGGYVILFSILSEYLKLMNLPDIIAAITGSFLEITTGIHAISLLTYSVSIKFILMSSFCAFGGLSSLVQTQSVLAPASLPIYSYFITKLLQGFLAALLSFLYVFLIGNF